MQKVWERYLRRAGLHLAYSQGFHPQPKIQQACPLPLGFISEQEIIDIWLDMEDDGPEKVARALIATGQPGIEIELIEPVNISDPALVTRVLEADYRVELLDPVDPLEIRHKIDQLIQKDIIIRERRGKTYNLRPLIRDISVSYKEKGAVVYLRLSAQEGATGRPEEVLAELGLDPFAARYVRTHLIISSPNSNENR
jgi:radical SAM-linked protein